MGFEEVTYEQNKLHQNVPYEEYAAQGGLRASDLHIMRRSMAHWKAHKADPPEETDALEFGHLFHMAIERPEWFKDSYIIRPKVDMRTNAGKDKIAQWQHDNEKKILEGAPVVKEQWVPQLTGMLRSALSHRLLGNLLRKGIRETSVWVTDPETGLLLQCRIDYLSERGIMVDIKTTRDASKEFFYWQIFGGRNLDAPFYILSGAHYTHVVKIGKVARGDSMTYVAIEKEEPYGIMIYPVDVGCLDIGERWRAHLTKQFADCQKTGVYPGYPEEAVSIEPPEHANLPPIWGEL